MATLNASCLHRGIPGILESERQRAALSAVSRRPVPAGPHRAAASFKAAVVTSACWGSVLIDWTPSLGCSTSTRSSRGGKFRRRATTRLAFLGLFAAFPNEFILLPPGAVQLVQLVQLACDVFLPEQIQSFMSVAAWKTCKPVGGRRVASRRQRVHRAHISQSCRGRRRGRSRWLSGRTLSLGSSKVSQVRL